MESRLGSPLAFQFVLFESKIKISLARDSISVTDLRFKELDMA
ncbi:hypothetical protein OP10G_3025 [Fimbriimonas ginsengisoli Gsoil 348]|uniref:Uncharacterized protein n=1 Tax=Fimbriimonas ginsengisoli Gsoil 348 TaxID=661478 RepID=A0A068NS64_FIMGI|nr:hypothetical protein OP10G_3025 [Fimbriimonas ginsengisoli Gsoil 348]